MNKVPTDLFYNPHFSLNHYLFNEACCDQDADKEKNSLEDGLVGTAADRCALN